MRHPPFGRFVAAGHQAGRLLVQPRMGFAGVRVMRDGLLAVRASGVPAIGTVTLDSYTRVGQFDEAARAVARGLDLNGFPIVTHGADRTARMLHGVVADDFPVQVRHGSAQPERIFRTMLAAGLTATEGGPVSYCLPYSRIPLRTATASWTRATRLLAEHPDECHLESFGGCMLGQLCPPSLLIAISVLECLFFVEHGMRSVSASYAQQTHPQQDAEALGALRRLCAEHLSGVDWHVVLYTYMGLFPRTPEGAKRLLRESARLAVRTGTERMIVKTVAEAHRIPTIEENVQALRIAHEAAASEPAGTSESEMDTGIHEQASALVGEVLGCAPTVARALPLAFEKGLLDVPYCLHPDNDNRTRSVVGPDGRLEWWNTGRMPLPAAVRVHREPLSHRRLLDDLDYQRRRFDQPVPA
ncbi:methylaspartate mutase [Actinosynnema sp. ALI-1.44]|uniref:methylaspartate mutase n=1 Tax=Actinosynnema sp. ALI-1.44 TaxID=1933779 RepID=UPI001ED9D1D6|nr:methylaspartate mutase [Actinosynnema sp. ALI-1.44]